MRFTTTNLLAHLRHHALAYVLAFAFAALMAAPYAYFTHTPAYRGVALMGQDAEEHYLARIREVYDGNPGLGYVFAPDYGAPPVIPGLGEDMVAYIGMALGLGVTGINLLSKLIFPFAIFLLLYGLSFDISRSRAAALVATTAATLGTNIMSNAHELVALLHGSTLADGVIWARPISPEVSDLLLVVVLWLLYRAQRRGSVSPALAGTIGVVAGLSLYVSIYTWSFAGVLLTGMAAYALWQHRMHFAAALASAGVVALLCDIPFVLNYLHVRAYPGYAAAAGNFSFAFGHTPQLGVWLALVLLTLLFVWPRALGQSKAFLLVCAAALVVVLNQQVITGMSLQAGHYHWYVTKPLAGIVLGLAAAAWAGRLRMPVVRLAGCALVVALLFADGALAQMHFYRLHAPAAIAAQAYVPLFEYLNATTSQSVLAGPELSVYLPIYTRDYAPNNGYIQYYLRSPNEAPATMLVVDRQSDNNPPVQGTRTTTVAGRFDIYLISK